MSTRGPVGVGRARRLEQRAWAAALVTSMLLPIALMPLSGEQDFTYKVFGVAVGYAAYMGMVLQVVMVSRMPALASSAGMDLLVRLHRYMGYALLVMVLTHVGSFVQANPAQKLGWLFFQERHLKAWTGAAATWAVVLLAVTSAWRARLGLNYELWRVLHLTLTAVAIFGAYVHVLVADDYTAFGPMRMLVAVGTLVAVFAVVYLRVGRTFAAAGRPYRVVGTEREAPGVTSLRLQADGHSGIAFRPGQFAWLRPGGAPYSLAEHPLSVASHTLDPTRVSFTIKAVGDHTRALTLLEPGSILYVDGPHGSWQPALPTAGYLLIVAGIGVVPAMSILRTLAASGRCNTPVTMIYGARCEQELLFASELEALRGQLCLDLVVTLSQPEGRWSGRRGRIGAALVREVAPADLHHRNVFVCGPGDFVDMVLGCCAALGVPADHAHGERFEGT